MSEPDLARAPAVPTSSRRLRWLAVLTAAVAGAIYLAISVGGIGSNIVYYWGPSQLAAAGAKAVHASIRLGGLVAPGSLVRGQGASALEFDVVDGGARVHVKSHGLPPQLFREGIGVVVEGTMTPRGYFDGSRLMVSHNNEYTAPADLAHADVKALMRSTSALATSGRN